MIFIDRYIKKALAEFHITSFHKEQPNKTKSVQAQIILVPHGLDNKLIDIIDSRIGEELIEHIQGEKELDIKGYKSEQIQKYQSHGLLMGHSKPHKVGMILNDDDKNRNWIIHRNGTVQYIENIEYEQRGEDDSSLLDLPRLAVRLAQVSKFAEYVFSKYIFPNSGYSKEVKVLVKLQSNNTKWGLECGDDRCEIFEPLDREYGENDSDMGWCALTIERNYRASELKLDYNGISESIMDEIYNCFGENCPPRDKNRTE